MTGQLLLSSLFTTLQTIQPSQKNLDLFREIQSSLSNTSCLNSFHQLKKSAKTDGLELEIMFYNESLIYDIVITRTTVDYLSVLTKSVNMLYLQTDYGEIVNENGTTKNSDFLKFTISYGGDLRTLAYQTEIKRFSEFNKINNDLLKIISK
ncbi:hypothetical protein [Pedobacter arcticus]|uniref:hypothetical protein n=1 Tax=Pedobacter arcticus TaxID=752140 RepID=UPI0003818117|nr:hypothetical protein [Pedobacter arcticus]